MFELSTKLLSNAVENTIMMKRLKSKTLTLTAFGAVALAPSAYAQAPSHNLVNSYRSSAITHIFISQSVEGEYGDFKLSSTGDSASLSTSSHESSAKWKGYNLTQTFGLELLKFVQFDAAHSMMNMRSANSSLEHLGGSRFSAGMRLVFLAPVANLEAGGGVIGSRYDYQRNLSTTDFYGSGVYYSIGMNYFISERVSMFGQAKSIDEHSVRSGGDVETSQITSKTSNIGAGFSLWL
jgi:hypothetical protein